MRKGDTILFETPPRVAGYGSVGGRREARGPLAKEFDTLITETQCGEKTWEKAESTFARTALETALRRAGVSAADLCAVFAGDLQCQCTASAYLMRDVDAPYLGLYGACSTMAEGLGLAACMVAGGMMHTAAALSSSHFCAAERQFRTPLDYGGKRTPTAQWTVTGAGAVVLAPGGPGLPADGAPVHIAGAAFGRVVDAGVTDITNMGAAMAPAAWDTIARYLAATGRTPAGLDAIFTGDLGLVGSRLLVRLAQLDGAALENHRDCGLLIYDRTRQAVGAGGSGAGCSACALCAHILPGLAAGRWRRVLLVSTGALMSQLTAQQGQSIPAVAHLVELAAGTSGQEGGSQ